MRESASTDLREPQGSNPLGPPGPELIGQRRSGRGGQRRTCQRHGGQKTQRNATHTLTHGKTSMIEAAVHPNAESMRERRASSL